MYWRWQGALVLQLLCQQMGYELLQVGRRVSQQLASETQTGIAADLQNCLSQRVSSHLAQDLTTKQMLLAPQVHAQCMVLEQHTMAHHHETRVFLL